MRVKLQDTVILGAFGRYFAYCLVFYMGISAFSKRSYENLSYFDWEYLGLVLSGGVILSLLCAYLIVWVLLGRILKKHGLPLQEFYALRKQERIELLRIGEQDQGLGL